jgi:RNA polymerase sigma-70 factor (ECF subfamily)
LAPCEDNEKVTVEMACWGDVAALGRLYERYYAPMVWVAYAVLLDRGLAEDAAQQAFATACEKMRGLREHDRFGPWLATICRHAAQDMLRRRRREARLQQDHSGESRVEPGNDGFDHAVKEAVDRLPAMYREVVVLHYYQDMSYQEMESVLGLSGDVVKGRLARARKRVRAYLRQEGFHLEQ